MSLPNAKEGRIYVAIGAFCWGRDNDPVKALKRAAAEGSPSYTKKAWRNVFALWDAPADSQIGLVYGEIIYKKDDEPPVLMGYFNKAGKPVEKPE